MSRVKTMLVLPVLLVALVVPQKSYADRRSYVWTYEYPTMPKGWTELEYYLTEEQQNLDKAKPNIWKHWIEAEYALTDHWDVAMYQMFKQSNTVTGDDFEYDGLKIRTRYRILEKDVLPVDVQLYLEYIMDDGLSHNALEGKLVLAKDIGDLNIAYNQIVEQGLNSGGGTENKYASGISYKAFRGLRIGVESKGNFTESEYWVGPTAVWWNARFYVTVGTAWGLNDKSDDLQVRMITGFHF